MLEKEEQKGKMIEDLFQSAEQERKELLQKYTYLITQQNDESKNIEQKRLKKTGFFGRIFGKKDD